MTFFLRRSLPDCAPPALNIAAVVAGIWAFWPGANVIAIFVAMLMPLAALLMVRLVDGVTLDTRKGSRRPSVSAAIFAPSMFLAVRAFDFWHVLDWGNFWLPFAVIFGVVNGAALLLAREVLLRDRKMIFCLLSCAAYAYGATVNLNGALDASPRTILHAMVTNKHTVSGRSTSYYLTLSPWGPRVTEEDVHVASSVYNSHAIGSTAAIGVRKGFFGMPYFTVW